MWCRVPAYVATVLLTVSSTGVAQPEAPVGEAVPRDLTLEEKQALHAKAVEALIPRAGRWTIAYRVRDRLNMGEFPVYDSAEPGKWGGWVDVPSWLPVVIFVRATGLVDGHGAPYTGPLLAKTNDVVEITGPYPEGFLCAVAGAVDLALWPKCPVFMDPHIPLSVVYRLPRFPQPTVQIGEELWPPPGVQVGLPPVEEVGIWGPALALAGVAHDADGTGFRMAPMSSSVVGAERTIRAEAVFAMRGGRPAWELPVRFQWELEPVGDQPRLRIENDGVTDPEGRAIDVVRVPREYTKGWVRGTTHSDRTSSRLRDRASI